jgi:hypothetical protein
MTTYTCGPTQAIQFAADAIFGYLPKGGFAPGTEAVRTHALTDVWRGYMQSVWKFEAVSIDAYKLALLILAGSAGTGTITTTGTAVEGIGTAFATQLARGYDIAPYTTVYQAATIASITDADTLALVAALAVEVAGKTFRFRPPAQYSAECYIATRVEDTFGTWRCMSHFPDPGKLERWGRKYLNVEIGFTLVERKA